MMTEIVSTHCRTRQQALLEEAARERLLRETHPHRRAIPAARLAGVLRRAADWLDAPANSTARAQS